jgi:tetratricopeptide (TPR) repeat protein
MAYDRLCQKIVITFFSTTNAYVADRMAEDCLLMPHSSMDLQLIDKLADTAVALGGGDDLLPYIQGCKAMSAYRLGHFNEAIEWAEASIKNSHADVPAKVKAYAVLAMAYRQLGEKEAARAALIKGDTLAPNISSGQADKDLGEAWVAWVFAKVSLNEADSLTQATSITNRVSNELQ